MPDDDPGPQRGHRHTRHGQQSLHPTSTAQVRRQVVVVCAQSTEIDDAAHPLLRRSFTKRCCRGCILRLEVGRGQRMHEVVGRYALLQCGSKRGRVGSVGPHRLSCTAVLPGPPSHRSDLETSIHQRRAQPPTHEPRGAGDEDGGTHPPSLPFQETGTGAGQNGGLDRDGEVEGPRLRQFGEVVTYRRSRGRPRMPRHLHLG